MGTALATALPSSDVSKPDLALSGNNKAPLLYSNNVTLVLEDRLLVYTQQEQRDRPVCPVVGTLCKGLIMLGPRGKLLGCLAFLPCVTA